MKSYPDTSFLYALYRPEKVSAAASRYARNLDGPLEVTTLLLFEFRQSIRFQMRLRKYHPKKGLSEAEGVRMLDLLETDLGTGALAAQPVSWPEVLAVAERLSVRHTIKNGHRALDILHIATALELGALGFLTYDGNQKKLAEAEGLVVPL